jgi:hypothetical protein
MKHLRFGRAALLACALAATACAVPPIAIALAQAAAPAADHTVVIPWGDLVSQAITAYLLPASATVAAAIFAFVTKAVGDRVAALLKTAQVDQLLQKAIEYGANTTAGAVKGQTLKIDVADEVLRKAIQFAIDNAPKWFLPFIGGDEGLRQKLIARMDLGEDASAAKLGASRPSPEAAAVAARA